MAFSIIFSYYLTNQLNKNEIYNQTHGIIMPYTYQLQI